MRSVLSCLAVLLFALTSQGRAQTSDRALTGHVPALVLQGKATRLRTMAPAEQLHLALQLQLRNQDELNGLLTRLYDPTSPDFHKFLSVDDFAREFGPSQQDYQAVVDFALTHGLKVTQAPRNRMLVEVDGTTEQVNAAFHVNMTRYQRNSTAETFFAPDAEPTIEAGLRVQHIAGLNNAAPPRPKSILKPIPRDTTSTYPPTPTGSGPYGSYVPSDFRAAYYGSGPLDGKGQSIGLVEFGGYDQVDLDNFYSTIGVKQTVPVNTVLLGGLKAPLDDQGNDAEPILDIVYALSVAPHLDQIRLYECCGANYNGSDSGPVVILNSMASENIAKQLSCSWGWGPEFAAEDPIFEEMAAQGQTFFAATGDYGSPQNPGNNTYDDYTPADSPWVTAVSMSLLTTHGPGGSWANDIYAGGAGGGFSAGPTPVPLPSYQAGLATAANQASGVYRNVPDVVIDGFGAFLCGGSNATNTHQCFPNADCPTCGNGGSSMSAPIWASFMALINEQAQKEGKPGIGFLNPPLYAIARGSNYHRDFHDVVGGSNNCCGQSYAYTAVPGFDLVSGWGTPNGPNLMADLLSSPTSFSLLASDAPLTLGVNDTTSTTITVGAINGFTGNVKLAVSGLPRGVTSSIDNNPTSGEAVVTLRSNNAVAAGSYVLSITGVGTGANSALKASTSVPLTVTSSAGNFVVGSSLTALSLAANTSDTANNNNPNIVTVTSQAGFSGSVTLSMKGLPAGVTASFSPAVLTPGADAVGSAVLTLRASSAAAVGSYSAAIVGISGTLRSSVPFILQITPETAHFQLTSPVAFALNVGKNGFITIPIDVTDTVAGFSEPVKLSLTGLPKGLTGSFAPSVVTPNASTGQAVSLLTVSADASSVPNVFVMSTITGTCGKVSATLQQYAGVTGTLTAPGTALPLNGTVNLVYSVVPDLLANNNYVAVFPHGASPQNFGPIFRATAAKPNGTVSLNLKGVPAGSYDAWIIYSGGPTTLAGPATFTINAPAAKSSSAETHNPRIAAEQAPSARQ